MPHGANEQVYHVFVGLWIVLGVFSAAFFFLNKNAALKRMVWPPFLIGVSMLFVAFMSAMGISTGMLVMSAPLLVFITLLNLRTVQFCDACGATVMSQTPLSRPVYCSKCGAKLPE